MKRLLLLIFFSGISIGFSQEKKDLLKNFDKSGMETSILYLKSPFMIIDSVQYLKNNMHHFYAVYKAISQSDLQNRFVPLKSLKEKATTLYATQVIPITILHSEFETISDDAFKDGRLIQDAKGFVKRATKSAHICV